MSTKSRLRERLGPRARTLAIDRVSSGAAVTASLRLTAADRFDAIRAARVLLKRHVSLPQAHDAVSRLAESGQVRLRLPMVEDLPALQQDLAALGLDLLPLEIPDVDVRALRHRLGLSQDGFALRFGFPVTTLRNWEQGRSRPDTASRLLLRLIEREPETVARVLDEAD